MSILDEWLALKESGLDGISHEDGWTLMATETAERLKAKASSMVAWSSSSRPTKA